MEARANSQPTWVGATRLRACHPKAQFRVKVRAPTNISKYDEFSNLGIWLEDYCLKFRMAKIKDDHLIIQSLPIHLAKGARA